MAIKKGWQGRFFEDLRLAMCAYIRWEKR